MKKISILLLGVTVAFAFSCNTNNLKDPMSGAVSGTAIGGIDAGISENDDMTKASEGKLVYTSEWEGTDDIQLSATLEVSSISDMQAATKATVATGSNEITRNTDGTVTLAGEGKGFWVNGYLDPKYVTDLSGTYDAGTYKFFGPLKATWDSSITECAHDEHTDGHWKFPEPAPKWRDRSVHHFWAYYPQVTLDATSNYESASFSHTQSDYTKDMVLAYHEQYWKEGDSGELWCLHFHHTLAAVKYAYQFSSYEYQKPKSDQTRQPVAKDGRISVNSFSILNYTSGTCNASKTGDDTYAINWDSLSGRTALETPNTVHYVVPQPLSKNVVMSIKDNKTGMDYDKTISLPTNFTNSTTPVTAWEQENFYNYAFNSRIVAPYVPEGVDGHDAGFYGKWKEVDDPIGALDMSLIKTLRIRWEDMPQSNSQGGQQYVYIIISKKEVTPTYTDTGKPNPFNTKENAWVNVLSDTDYNNIIGDAILTINGLGTGCKFINPKATDDDYISVKVGASGTPFENLGPVNYGATYSGFKYEAEIMINIEDLIPDGGDYHIYLVCRDGSQKIDMEGTMWILKNFSIKIMDYRTN